MQAAWSDGLSSLRRIGMVMALVALASAGTASATPTTEGACTPGPTTLCLLDQFSVEVSWEDADSNTGAGQVLPFTIGDAGYFSYDDPRYLELQVQVLDGCSFNGNYWVFMAGLSAYDQAVTVTDTVGGGVAQYANTLGQFDLSIGDTAAIPCPVSAHQGGDPVAPPSVGSFSVTSQLGAGAPPLGLGNGRFEVRVNWEDFNGGTGVGQPHLVTSDSGAFTFFSPQSPQLAIKIFDGSAINGSFWVVFGGTTNLQFILEVTDRCTGQVSAYSNPLGVSVGTVADTAAFDATPSCLLLFDGFESGGTSAWSAVFP